MFGTIHRQPYVLHRFKMLLASKMRKEIHENLSEHDVICYTDYSKELELFDQEQCKSEMYGASQMTKQLIGQVLEMTVKPPSAPLSLSYDPTNHNISFEKPSLDGGSRIQCFEVHIKPDGCNTWYLFKQIEVKYLSSDPVIPDNLFGRLGGTFHLRVYSKNLSGLGAASDLTVDLGGDLPFRPKLENELTANHFEEKYVTFLVEYFFFSDHSDAPKDWRTITECKKIALADIRVRFSRDIKRLITVTDTGGENNGSTVSVY